MDVCMCVFLCLNDFLPEKHKKDECPVAALTVHQGHLNFLLFKNVKQFLNVLFILFK